MHRTSVHVLFLAILLMGGWPTAAAAHPIPGVNDFYAGMLHPVMTIEYVLPLLALSLLAGAQDRRVAIGMLATIPCSLVTGALLSLFAAAPVPDPVRYVNLVSMPVVGALVAAAARIPVALAVAMTATIGAAIGWANGAEVGDQVSFVRFVPGIALSGFLLAAYGIGCVRGVRVPWAAIAFRVCGSWILAVGVLLLGLQ
jgi:hydrogenase/urease accessory protein HupE